MAQTSNVFYNRNPTGKTHYSDCRKNQFIIAMHVGNSGFISGTRKALYNCRNLYLLVRKSLSAIYDYVNDAAHLTRLPVSFRPCGRAAPQGDFDTNGVYLTKHFQRHFVSAS